MFFRFVYLLLLANGKKGKRPPCYNRGVLKFNNMIKNNNYPIDKVAANFQFIVENTLRDYSRNFDLFKIHDVVMLLIDSI